MIAVLSVLIYVAVGIYTRKVPNRRMLIMAAATIPSFVGFLTMSLLPNTAEYKWIKWAMYLITVPFILALFLGWTLSKFLTSPTPPSLSFPCNELQLTSSPNPKSLL